jgi:hypothetical protein
MGRGASKKHRRVTCDVGGVDELGLQVGHFCSLFNLLFKINSNSAWFYSLQPLFNNLKFSAQLANGIFIRMCFLLQCGVLSSQLLDELVFVHCRLVVFVLLLAKLRVIIALSALSQLASGHAQLVVGRANTVPAAPATSNDRVD